MSVLNSLYRRFIRDENGTAVVESIIVLPLFVWGFTGLFVYWDAYRTVNTVQKASYTISDLLSRSQSSVNDAFINGMATTFNNIVGSGTSGEIRVTSYTWSGVRNQYEVIFSKSPNQAMDPLTTDTLAMMAQHLPIMSDGDSAVLVETMVPYKSTMAVGIPDVINQIVVTRPRFLPKLCHTSFSC